MIASHGDTETRRTSCLHYLRVSVTVLLIVASAMMPVAGQAPRATPADEWRQFRGSPQLRGVSASTLPATLKLLWTYESSDPIDSSAAIAGGVVYVGAGTGDLLALDLASGKLLWKYTTGNLIGESSPAVGTDAVFVGDLGGLVHAVNLSDGKPLWTFKTGAEIKSSPVLINDVVLIGSYDTHLYALDARSGKLRWKVATKGQVHATPAVQDGLAFVAGCDAVFRAIRVADGTEAYHVESGAYTGASPVLDNGRAYFGTFNYEVLAVDLKQRRIEWRYSDPESRFPVLFVRSARQRSPDRGRPRQAGARD